MTIREEKGQDGLKEELMVEIERTISSLTRQYLQEAKWNRQ